MLVPFPVGRLPDASLLWLNERWFHDLGMAIHDTPTRARISASLLERFAVTSIEAHCVAGSFGGQTLGADRYGGSGGAIHGGSGRCGSDGMLIAKGTGPTPLVSEAHDWSHSHGCLYLYDAIREAVASEILNAEAPHGAVPIVAIIDAGFSLARTDADEPERCAILIRPAFLRLAHFERSLYFGTSGSANSDQFQDSLRVKDAIHFADEHAQLDAGNPNGLGVDLSEALPAPCRADCRKSRASPLDRTPDKRQHHIERAVPGFRRLPRSSQLEAWHRWASSLLRR